MDNSCFLKRNCRVVGELYQKLQVLISEWCVFSVSEEDHHADGTITVVKWYREKSRFGYQMLFV